MHTTLVASCLALAAFVSLSANADEPTDPRALAMAEVCAQYAAAVAPPKNGPSARLNQRHDCDDLAHSGMLYIDARSYAELRQCALLTRDALTLATVYADGLGVPKNIPLATRFACSSVSNGADYTRPGMLTDGSLGPASLFESCEDAGDTVDMGRCIGVKTQVASVRLHHRLGVLVRTFRTAQRMQLARLAQSKRRYLEAKESAHETQYGYGTMEEISRTRDVARIDADFVEVLTGLSGGQYAKRKQAHFDEALLARKLREQIAASGSDDEVRLRKLEVVEQAYHAYRERWVGFAKTNYPAASSTALREHLDRRRIAALKETAD